MSIDAQNRITVLLSLLNERYNASHKMRERSFKFSLWVLGFIIVVGAWLILNSSSLGVFQKGSMTAIIAIAGGFTFWFLKDINRGFRKNREVMIDIEKALGCYETGVYLESKVLFPAEYQDPKGKLFGGHFKVLYGLVIAAFLITTYLLWFGDALTNATKGIEDVEGAAKSKIEHSGSRESGVVTMKITTGDQ